MENIVLPLLKLGAKLKKSNEVVDIFGTFAVARSILVLMPDKLEDFGIARKFVKKLLNDFKYAKFNFVLRESYISLLDDGKSYGIIFVSEKDIGLLGLPRKKLKQKVITSRYDIIIDLNYDFHLLSTYLCRKCNAPIKICLDNEDREPFYNFYLRTQRDEALENKYEKLVNYLNSFANPKIIKTVK